MNNVRITAFKELRSIFRDKKTLILLFTIPLMIPLLVFFYGYMFDNLEEDNGGTNTIGVVYELDAKEKEYFEQMNIEYKVYENKKAAQEAYDNKDIEAYIVKREQIYTIYANEGSQNGQVLISKIGACLEEYNRYLGEEYIKENNLDPDRVFNNLSYKVKNTTNVDFMLNMIYNIAFTYTIMAIVIAASNMAMGATATEKENGTLETILTLPISTKELIIGKHIGSAIMSILVSLFSLLVTVASLIIGNKTFKSFKTFNFNITPQIIIYAILTVLSASILISGLALALTAMCKTSKEAQSKSSILSFVSLIPMFVSFAGLETSKYLYIIPVCNYVQILLDLFNNNYSLINVLAVIASSILYIIIIINIIIKQYKSEKVLFTN